MSEDLPWQHAALTNVNVTRADGLTWLTLAAVDEDDLMEGATVGAGLTRREALGVAWDLIVTAAKR